MSKSAAGDRGDKAPIDSREVRAMKTDRSNVTSVTAPELQGSRVASPRRIRTRHLLDEARFGAPSRYPDDAYRVRWVRRTWARPAGVPAWNHRWYVNRRSAERFARKLADDGAVVQVDRFDLDHITTTHVHQEDHP